MRVAKENWPKYWKPVVLDELCEINIGKTPSRSNSDYWGGTHTWVSIADMRSRVVTDSKESISDKALEDGQARLVKAGTLLMSFKLTIGKMAFAGKDLFTNEAIASLPVKNAYINRLDLEFLFWALQAVPIEGEADLAVKGRTLNKQKLARIEIPIPYPDDPTRSLAEQRRIVAHIEAIFTELRECQQTLGELRKETGRLMEAVRHEVFSALSQTEKTKLFDEVADSRLGKMLNQDAQRGTNPKPYLRNANVLWDEFLLDDVLEMDFTASEEETFRLHSGDLLICEGGDIGRTAVWEDQLPECYFQKALHRARLRDSKASPRYLMHYMAWATRNGAIAKLRTGAAIPHLTGVKLKTLDVIWPDPRVQIEVTDYLDSVGRGIKEMQNTQQDDYKWFQEMEQAILNQAFRGEL